MRGSNDSEGIYDLFGAQEQQYLYDAIEWGKKMDPRLLGDDLCGDALTVTAAEGQPLWPP